MVDLMVEIMAEMMDLVLMEDSKAMVLQVVLLVEHLALVRMVEKMVELLVDMMDLVLLED